MKFEKVNFTTFLAERETKETSEEKVSYKQKLDSSDPEVIIKMIEKNCTNMDIKKPYWRGMKESGDCLLIDGSKGHRKSADTSNFYTMLLDHFAKKGQPLRSKSLICETNAGKSYAQGYANAYGSIMYAVYPFNNAEIGFVGTEDIWDIEVKIGNKVHRIDIWNDVFRSAKLSDSSYKDFIDSIKRMFDKDMKELSVSEKAIYSAFDEEVSNVESYLAKSYSIDTLNFKIGTTTNIDNNKKSEVWISGKCIFVSHDFWEKHLK